ncbi:MAG: hypothetical protein WAU91_07430 [Desulfatitalea sp.]
MSVATWREKINAVHHARSMGWRCHALMSGHLPMVTDPEALAALLMTKGE